MPERTPEENAEKSTEEYTEKLLKKPLEKLKKISLKKNQYKIPMKFLEGTLKKALVNS